MSEVVLTNKLLGYETYFKVFLGKSGAYKSKHTLKSLLIQYMVHFTFKKTNSKVY